MLKINYLSHSCFIFDDGKHRIIVDPYLTGNPTCKMKVEDVKVDYVVLTHAHGDHISDLIKIAKRNSATVIAVNELANYAIEKGLNAFNMHIGGAYNFPFGRLKFTIAHHGSALPDGRYMGVAAGVLLTMGDKTIYHTGDTGLFLDMKLIGEMNKIDAMCVCIGDCFTMGIDDAVKAVEFVNPELAIPIHYQTFPVIQTDPFEFKEKVEKKLGKKVRVMEYGETITL